MIKFINLADHYPTTCMIDNLKIIKNNTKNVPSYRDRKFFNSLNFCNEIDKKLGELVSNNLPFNRAIFNSVFDKFITLTKIIDKHAPLERLNKKNWQKNMDN